MSSYIENRPELGMKIEWENVTIQDQVKTARGTFVEMVHRPNWGVACYMDNQIQSCERDEAIYHTALVHPALTSSACKKRVMIIGGGEGATLREVVKWKEVEKIDMYEWDKDVITLFQTKYPQWAKGAWEDPRVTLYHDDIFAVISQAPSHKYDVIIVDLFDPSEENKKEWTILCNRLADWSKEEGIIAMYAGIRTPQSELLTILHESRLMNRIITPYYVYIPSFSGESLFFMLSDHEANIEKKESSSPPYQARAHTQFISW